MDQIVDWRRRDERSRALRGDERLVGTVLCS